ncbi:MAG: DUF58 domain-containing protein [Candidatus Omnitrophica bacterium]|nr:DUF58 domain-containing protein [Candidatus Omnitrophota bacterium]MBU1933379.1 DUF58 domain-containing protein [Candidatus Omnitrophota bacterium]
MFTSKSIFLLLSVVILLAIAWNTDITMVYIFFVVGFVMFLLSFIHLQFNIPDVSITRDVQDTVYEDDIINVKMTIHNRRRLPLYFFELLDMFPGGPPEEQNTSLFILSLGPKEDKKISYIANCYKRGVWKMGPTTVVSQDALGFFKTKKVLKVFSEILVYPNLFRIFSFPQMASGSVSWMGVETAKISGDSHEFYGVREYQRGDSMSRIHWFSSARHNKLIVKQFERNAVQEATIVLDLKKGHDIGSGKDTTLEYTVKIAGSIARYLLNERVLVQMVGYGKEAVMLHFGRGDSHMYSILEYLAKVQADGDFTLSQALEEVSFITPPRSTLITVMLDNDTDSLSSLVQFKVKGVKLIVIVLATSTFGHMSEEEYLDIDAAKRFDESLANLEAIVYRVSKGDDLEKKFETA